MSGEIRDVSPTAGPDALWTPAHRAAVLQANALADAVRQIARDAVPILNPLDTCPVNERVIQHYRIAREHFEAWLALPAVKEALASRRAEPEEWR